MDSINIINPDIWKINDDTFENTYFEVPIECNFALLSCIEKGMFQYINEVTDEKWKEYTYKSLPEKEKWNQVMCFLCGAAFVYGIKGGLSCQRASAITNKYTGMDIRKLDKNSFVEQQMNLFYDFAKEVYYAKKFKTDNKVVNAAINYIEDNIDFSISPRDVANFCSYSLSGLQHIFSKNTGFTLSEYIRKKKTEKACFLLHYTDLSCTKIAEKLSYSSQSYFISQFKKETGTSPNKYRKTNTENKHD